MKRNKIKINSNDIDTSNSGVVRYLDPNDFQKKIHSLKKYCMQAYKDLIFDINFKDYRNQPDGKYSLDLKTSREFKFVHGQIKVNYYVKDKIVYIDSLEPELFWLYGYLKMLDTYKGIPYKDEKDIFKIELLMAIKKLEKEKK